MSDTLTAWRRASSGLYLLGFGILLLLTTTEYLDWGFWLEAITYWPLVLVAVGVRMLFERTKAPWAILLAPAIVLGTLAWVASRSPSPSGADWSEVQADAPGGTGRWTFEAAAAMTGIDITAADLPAGRLLQGRISPLRAGDLRTHDRAGETRVELASFRRHRMNFVIPSERRAWEIELSRSLPLTLIVQGAFTEGDLDLDGADLSRIDLEGAFHDLAFHLPPPGSDVRFSVGGAFNSLTILVPPETPVSVSTEGAINLVDGRPDPPAGDAPGYRLRVHGFMNRVEILTDEALRGRPTGEPAPVAGEPASGGEPVPATPAAR